MAIATLPGLPLTAPTLVDDDVLRLRPWRPDDAAPLAAALQDSMDSIGRWLDWCTPAYSIEDARRWLAGVEASWAGGGHGECALAIVLPGDTLAGCIAVNRFRPQARAANLGYWLCHAARGRQLMPRAIRLFAPWAIGRFGLRRLEILVAAENAPSRRVAERSGARFEGIDRQRLAIHGQPHDAARYVLTPGEIG
jgi:RimJ/RimL family protein N-acetyltransferase